MRSSSCVNSGLRAAKSVSELTCSRAVSRRGPGPRAAGGECRAPPRPPRPSHVMPRRQGPPALCGRPAGGRCLQAAQQAHKRTACAAGARLLLGSRKAPLAQHLERLLCGTTRVGRLLGAALRTLIALLRQRAPPSHSASTRAALTSDMGAPLRVPQGPDGLHLTAGGGQQLRAGVQAAGPGQGQARRAPGQRGAHAGADQRARPTSRPSAVHRQCQGRQATGRGTRALATI